MRKGKEGGGLLSQDSPCQLPGSLHFCFSKATVERPYGRSERLRAAEVLSLGDRDKTSPSQGMLSMRLKHTHHTHYLV